MLIDFRKRGREGEREGEKHRCERETSINCLSCTWPEQPRHVPWLGIEPRGWWMLQTTEAHPPGHHLNHKPFLSVQFSSVKYIYSVVWPISRSFFILQSRNFISIKHQPFQSYSLLIGTFNPVAFKLVVNRYVFIVILLLIF